VVALLSLITSAVISTWLHKLITRPVESLVRAVRDMSEGAGHDIRVEGIADPELSVLVSGFNDMLYRLQYYALFDALTGLPNRRLVMDRLRHAIGTTARSRSSGALLFIDLDNFKTLNDTRGHEVGDLLLVETGKRLRAAVRSGDTVGRLGGDEFVIILEDLGEHAEVALEAANRVARKILAMLSATFLLQEREHYFSCSIGGTLFSFKEERAEDVLRSADTAMFEAKRGGRNTIRFFDPSMQRAVEAQAELSTLLRNALSDGEFRLHYQVQVDTAGTVIGAEALLRWEHPGRGLIPPGGFIPLAEETGLIVPIGQWVLEAACAQLLAWQRSFATLPLNISVNVSARQFRQPDFADQVEAVLSRYDVNPAKLSLEVTESLFMEEVGAVLQTMNRLRAKGITFGLDDFGTGYSSLSQLRCLPFRQVKMDQSFVRNIANDPYDAAIAQAILAMARTLGLETVAEGVETAWQLDFLRAQGCHYFQGYYIGRPVPPSELEARLQAPGSLFTSPSGIERSRSALS
jgi:diguanylate cyclase (GGDEF)-like protein